MWATGRRDRTSRSPPGHDMNIEGTVRQAGRYLAVSAANNLTIQSALSTIDESSSSHSVNASIGVSSGVGLTGFTLAGTASAGFMNSSSTTSIVTNTMSQLSGGAVTLKSGGNTTIAGATVTGGTVTANVGGSLSVGPGRTRSPRAARRMASSSASPSALAACRPPRGRAVTRPTPIS